MRIAFNATPLLSPLTGIGHYTYQLSLGLQTIPNLSIDFFYASGWSHEIRNKPVPAIRALKSIIKRVIPNSYRVARYMQQAAFNKNPNLQNISVYHEPNFLPYKFKGPTVITAHDLSWIRYPDMHPIERLRSMNRNFEPGLKQASLIITDSLFVKQELIDVFGISPQKIRPIYLGVEDAFCPKSSQETQEFLSKHNLTHGKYILSVGTLEPRKNMQNTLRAYMQLPKDTRKHYPLIIVGMKGWNTSPLEQQLEPLIRNGEIRLMGYLPREDLIQLTAGALTMVYPSLYEGFGLPPLEAMSCGVPAIVSNVSSLPEVVGDSGLLVDPHDVEALSLSMQKFIDAPEIRHDYANKAYAQSLTFSWQRCVQETLNVYNEVAYH